MRPLLRTLEVLSIGGLASVVVLLTNLATVHHPGLASALGPVHGALHLSVAVSALLGRRLSMRTRSWALVPVLGGVLALVDVRRETRRVGEAA